MKWVAFVTWVITAGGGFMMLGIWLKHGGMQQSGGAAGAPSNERIRPPRILTHFALAATGLVIWIIYLASDSDGLAWVAFALLLIVALLGFSMLAIWLRQRSRGTATASAGGAAGAGTGEPAERRFPTPVVVLHGLVAATTLVLVLLVAAGVGD
jgi:hypothetical protein